MVIFLRKNIFARFGTLCVLISDEGSHFCSKEFVLAKYSVRYRMTTASNPQVNGHAKVSNYEIKQILEKTIILSRKDWAAKLDDALWAYKTTYTIPLGMSPYKLVYGKNYHLPIVLEKKTYGKIKELNLDLELAKKERLFQLQELEEIFFMAYENTKMYKEKSILRHDAKIQKCKFLPGEKALVFNSRLKLFLSKLKSRWTGPYTIHQVTPQGTIELIG